MSPWESTLSLGILGYTWTLLFLLSEDAALPEHCFPRANKKPSTNIPEILEHSCLPCGSLCSGVRRYNALHGTGNALRPYQSPACWLITHILAGISTLFSLFLPHTYHAANTYLSGDWLLIYSPVWGPLQTPQWHSRLNFYRGLFANISDSCLIPSGSFRPQLELSFSNSNLISFFGLRSLSESLLLSG